MTQPEAKPIVPNASNVQNASNVPNAPSVLNRPSLPNAPNVPVLMYHHISPAGGMICTTPQHFNDQLAALKGAGYSSLTATQFADYLAGGTVPEKSVLITFDDGYLNNWVYAHPLLQRHGMNAILFAVTSWIGTGPCRPFFDPQSQMELPPCPDHAACKAAIENGQADSVMARWEELNAMLRAGTFEVFSHTHTHTRWDKVWAQDPRAKKNRIAEELLASQQALKKHLGVDAPHLCWPQGYFDADYLDAAHTAGFKYLYTTDPWGQNKPFNDPAHIFRFAVRNKNGSWLLRRVGLTRHPRFGPWYHAFKAWKKKRRNA